MTDSDEWFAGLAAEQRVQLEKLRSMILDADAQISEDIKWSRPCYSRHKLFCYLQKAKAHVTIGFQQGEALADPNQLLQGEGKGMRHVKIALGESFDAQAIGALIREALRHDAELAE